MSNKELLAKIISAMEAAFSIAAKQSAVTAYEKSTFDVVTNVDYLIEQYMMDSIKGLEPDAVFLSEEYNPETATEGRVWIIDPIDGTCNYANGIDIFGVQCALYDKGEAQLAAIYLPTTGECFSAIRNEGAWMNGKPINRIVRPAEKSIISFGDFIHSDPEKIKLEHTVMAHVAPRVERIRMVGAASVDFAYCAIGRFDGNMTFTANAWDIVPGILICKEAGLFITDVYGDAYNGSNRTVAVFSSQELLRTCVIEKPNDPDLP